MATASVIPPQMPSMPFQFNMNGNQYPNQYQQQYQQMQNNPPSWTEPLKDTRITHPNQHSHGDAHAVENMFTRMSPSQQGGQHAGSAQHGYPPNMAGHRSSPSMSHYGGAGPSLGDGAIPIGMGPGPQHHGQAQSYANNQQQMRNMSNAGLQQHHQQRVHSMSIPEASIPDMQNIHAQNYTSQQQVSPQQDYGSISPMSMSPQMKAALMHQDPMVYPVHNVHAMPQFPPHIGRPQQSRRSTFAGYPHPQGHFDEDSDDEFAEFAMLPHGRPQLAHRGSLPNGYPPQMVEFPHGHRSLVPNPMVVGAPVAGPIANTPVQTQLVPRGPNLFERPYSVSSGYIMGHSLPYPTLSQDINALRMILQPIGIKYKNLDTRALINIFVPKSPYEIDALRHGYRKYAGEDLGTLLKQRLVGAEPHVLYGFLGMALGVQNFDIWLTTHENVRDVQDSLIDIYIGRNPQDLRLLADGFTKLGSSISTITNYAVSAELQTALGIVSEVNRPDTNVPVDAARVSNDVEILISTLSATFPRSSDLFNILLRRSDTHISQMALHYQMKTNQPLDKHIRENPNITPMANKIAVHAVRTASNITYRDCMLLRDALGHNNMLGGLSKKKLAIRACRMHKFRQHWKQIKADYIGMTGKEFVDKMGSLSGVFRELMTAMAMV